MAILLQFYPFKMDQHGDFPAFSIVFPMKPTISSGFSWIFHDFPWFSHIFPYFPIEIPPFPMDFPWIAHVFRPRRRHGTKSRARRLASPRRRKAKASLGSISKARSKSSSSRGLEKNDKYVIYIYYHIIIFTICSVVYIILVYVLLL